MDGNHIAGYKYHTKTKQNKITTKLMRKKKTPLACNSNK